LGVGIGAILFGEDDDAAGPVDMDVTEEFMEYRVTLTVVSYQIYCYNLIARVLSIR
jgi:hypothetical protein